MYIQKDSIIRPLEFPIRLLGHVVLFDGQLQSKETSPSVSSDNGSSHVTPTRKDLSIPNVVV